MDDVSTQSSSSSQSNQNNKDKKFYETIAKVLANNPKQNKTIQIHQIPSVKTKFRLNDEIKKRPTNQTPKKSSSIPLKIDRIKEQSKQIKKITPPLLQNLMKTNEEVIRPLHTPIPTTPTNNNQVDN